MKIIDFDYSVEYGFAWIIVEGKQENSEWTVQACLSKKNNDEDNSIEMSDCGHNWGICGDANADAFEYYGENRCMKALFNKARENGIIVIN